MSNTINSASIQRFLPTAGSSDAADLKSDLKALALNRSAESAGPAPQQQIGSYGSALSEAYDGDTAEALAAAAKRGAAKTDGIAGDAIAAYVESKQDIQLASKSGANSDGSGQDKSGGKAAAIDAAFATQAVEGTTANFKSKTHVSLKRDHQKLMEISGAMEKFELSSMVNAPTFKKLTQILSGEHWQKSDVSATSINAKIARTLAT